MSHAQLQRVVVRMLHDPELVDRVYADPDAALAGLDLSAVERRWLVAPDRRAWATDPYRRGRGLTGLLEEYPCASALALRHHGLGQLERFFSSPRFHDCVQSRGSVAAAFGDYLSFDLAPGKGGARARRQLTCAARIERAIARVRRASPPVQSPATDADLLRLAPWADALELPGHALDLYQAVSSQLEARARDAPVVDLLARGEIALRRLPELTPQRSEHLIIERAVWRDPEASPALGGASGPLVALLDAARTAIDRDALLARARDLGADPGDDAEIIDGLVEDRLLVRC